MFSQHGGFEFAVPSLSDNCISLMLLSFISFMVFSFWPLTKNSFCKLNRVWTTSKIPFSEHLLNYVNTIRFSLQATNNLYENLTAFISRLLWFL